MRAIPRAVCTTPPAFYVGVSLLLAGCASSGNTLAQDLAWERWNSCYHPAEVSLDTITPDGEIRWTYRGTGSTALQECLRKAAEEQGQRIAMLKAPEPVSPPAEGVSLVVPVWKRGDEWAYRWESPRGKGTFVWSVDREETVNGTAFYVIKAGTREIFWRKADLAYYMDKVAGVVEVRVTPPYNWASWPLATGQTWEVSHTRETPVDRQTEDLLLACLTESEEVVTVPAGTFGTFKIACRNQRTSAPYTEVWYSPVVKSAVRLRRHLNYGVEERELIAFKLR